MKRMLFIGALALIVCCVAPARAQETDSRDVTRDKLSRLLTTVGQRKEINVTFKQSTQSPYVFSGVMRDGLTNCDSLEIVILVTKDATIAFEVFPHFKGGYVNVDKAKNITGLMRKLLNMSSHNFLFWAADDSGDVYAGYTVTLESGFPTEAITVVLLSMKNTDGFVGDMRPFIEGSGGN